MTTEYVERREVISILQKKLSEAEVGQGEYDNSFEKLNESFEEIFRLPVYYFDI